MCREVLARARLEQKECTANANCRKRFLLFTLLKISVGLSNNYINTVRIVAGGGCLIRDELS